MYIRWGRETCTDNASLVYNGTAAGSPNDAGGTSDIFCMPGDPSYKHMVNGNGRYLKTHLNNIRYDRHHIFSNISEANVPCAVCQSDTKSVAFLQPGKISCPVGWTKEYAGYLIADEYKQRSAICMDAEAEASGYDRDRDYRDYRNRGLISAMHASCSGLKCPPYNPNGLITCTLCTK